MIADASPPGRFDDCVHRQFELQAALTPDALALAAGSTSLTYRQLNERANQLAHRLRAAGIVVGSRVGILLPRSIDAVVAIYGVLKAGGAYVPLDPAYPRNRLAHMADSIGLQAVISHSLLGGLLETPPGVTRVALDADAASLSHESSENPQVDVTADDPIYVIFTSGSTGQPKGAAVRHRGFANLVRWFRREFAISARDRTLVVSALGFDLTQKNLFATLLSGGSVHLCPTGPYDVTLQRDLIERHAITLLNCTPSAFYPLIETPVEATLRGLSSLRVVILGGEPISVARLRPWLNSAPCHAEVANTYGPTECSDICGFHRLNRHTLDAYPFVPLGRPIDHVQLAIVDENLQPCPPGTAGELIVGGIGVGAGYVNDPELTARKFIPNHLRGLSGPVVYRTGDQVRQLPDGVIEFLGRLDHQVKIRGYRIELHEIEAVLGAAPDVREAIVVVRPSPLPGGEPRLAAYLTTRSGAPADLTALKAHAHAFLPEYMVPPSLEWLPALPLSPNGKVDRRALGARSEPAGGTPPAAAGNEVESRIRELWREVLGGVEAGRDDNFFDLGGSSIHVARVHAALQQWLGREIPITDLFAHPTLRTLAAHFGSANGTGTAGSDPHQRARLQRAALAARRTSRPSHVIARPE
ncbi:MAG: non-ribosomal peptide synthetase [Opitutaceae bacterium]|nr:non-ribosomal peptide synthetase [Opitutaceae bacterium]